MKNLTVITLAFNEIHTIGKEIDGVAKAFLILSKI